MECSFFGSTLPTFAKPARAATYLVALLASRGLSGSDPAAASRQLATLGYYRLSGYTLLLELPGTHVLGLSGRPIYQRTHVFRPGASWEDLVAHYELDRELRLGILDAIERIEVAARTAIGERMTLAHGDPQWLVRPTNFNARFRMPGARGTSPHDDLLRTIERETRKYDPTRRNASCDHYYETYTSPRLPPSWMVAEQLSLGNWSRIYAALSQRADRKAIASTFEASPPELGSWLHALSHLRNLCAHHARLLGANYVIAPVAPPGLPVGIANTSFAGLACVVHRLLKTASPGAPWPTRLLGLFDASPVVDVHALLGFPPGWSGDRFWS